ncbi:hypothetical protein GE09DRAFT_1062217 [Coniochaeta sp. 2T2.1]|nr:hypothetical protein GE09DRAFT_1062217 [Coniochaeta sp. 2T2.1]
MGDNTCTTTRPDLGAVPHNDPRDSISSDGTAEEKLEAANFSVSLKPHKPFPPVITGHLTGARMKSFNLCGETKNDLLFKVSVHMGYSSHGPLGTRPGIYLHNGMSVKDPILAAAGDESQWSARVYAFHNKSVVLLPRLPGEKEETGGGEWVTETIVSSTTGADVVFRFAVNIPSNEGGSLTRERFQWSKFKKGTDHEYPAGGYKLFWLPSSTDAPDHGCVAVWELGKGVSKYWNHMFTLKFVGDARSELGNRGQAVVVVTAARLWMMRLQGKTKKTTISLGEKIGGKSEPAV